MTKPEREHRAREIIQESGQTPQHISRSSGRESRDYVPPTVRMVDTTRAKPETQTREAAHRRVVEMSPEWINPRLGDVQLSNVNNLALKNLVSEMSKARYRTKTIGTMFANVIKMVVGSAIGTDGEEVYPRKSNMTPSTFPTWTVSERQPSRLKRLEQILYEADGQQKCFTHCSPPAAFERRSARAGSESLLGWHVEHPAKLWNGNLQSPKTRAGVRRGRSDVRDQRECSRRPIGERKDRFPVPRGER